MWEASHKLALEVYRATGDFPKEERFGLVAQLRRAASSVPANIAEGCGREGDGELGRFLVIASGSASELEYHLLLARDLGLLPIAQFESLDAQLQSMRKMLTAFIQKVRPAAQGPRKPAANRQ